MGRDYEFSANKICVDPGVYTEILKAQKENNEILMHALKRVSLAFIS